MVTTNAEGLEIILSRVSSTRCQSTLAAREAIDISTNQTFYELVRNVLDTEIQLLKHTKVAQKVDLLSTTHAMDANDRKAFPMNTSEASTNSELIAFDRTAIQQAPQQTNILTVHYNAARFEDLQISHQTALIEASSENV